MDLKINPDKPTLVLIKYPFLIKDVDVILNTLMSKDNILKIINRPNADLRLVPPTKLSSSYGSVLIAKRYKFRNRMLMRYKFSESGKIIHQDINGGMKPSELSNKYEVSRSTIYYIKKNKDKECYTHLKEDSIILRKCFGDSLSADMSWIEIFKEKILELTIEMGLNDSLTTTVCYRTLI
ncbi:hypothetical protein A3Q56_02679 [Intoshia linei]|uniref:HTH psq-type domain-containing protein n=1 Tax=Intoshia linei TaxID=1819745 RepID=A0A177B7C7_9BILA|nr:hypothetical protein A3Q56_02679 [Intoshia linei]